ncbi:hypothetical protein K501DRAFT_172123 [Backusella circina FSU 941]|nr:hypothetical protein K501DRAFT_172123 [Backusella circina FSU 941]
MREDLINSALSFLSDPKVQDAPLTKKVSFLESKGMTSEEIKEAMARSNGKSSASAQTTTAMSHQPMMIQQPPPLPARPSYDWKDFFIAAVLAGGFTYGAWTLAKRLYATWFQVPSQDEIDQDKEKLDAQFQAVEDSLQDIREQTNAALTTTCEQSKKVDESIDNMSQVIEELQKNDEERDSDFNDMKNELDTLKITALENSTNMQNVALMSLQNDIKSLKSSMLNRREQTPQVLSTVNSNSRTSIPAWQVASNSSAGGSK